MKLAVIVTAYQIRQSIVDKFFRYNHHENVIAVTDKRVPKSVTRIQAPEQDPFSITRTANIGIRHAVEQDYDIIIKTDIDCMITPEVVTQCMAVKEGQGFCFRYWHIDDFKPLGEARLDDRCIGTTALSSVDWSKLQGYNEHMFGYGYDDYEIKRRAKRKNIIIEELTDPKVYHFWHEKHNQDSINPINREFNITHRHNYSNPHWGIVPE